MDIEFGTDGWRTTVDEFTTPRVRAVGQAVADHLRETVDGDHADSRASGLADSRASGLADSRASGLADSRASGLADSRASGLAVAVGHDPRAGSREAAEELCRVLCANGIDAHLPERDIPTPVVAWTVTDRGLDGALQVTASHNPPTYNGIKFIPADGAPALPDVTDRLAANLRPPDPIEEAQWGSVEESDFLEPYFEHALAFAGCEPTGSGEPAGSDESAGPDEPADSNDLSGVTVAHDAMHGSGRGVTDELLSRTGADVVGLRDGDDPEFGGTAPEPSADHLEELIARVEEGEADLGVANDGDADRIGVVTPGRGYVDPNWLFAALYDYLLERDASSEPGGGEGAESRGNDAVRTVSTTFLVDLVAAAHGARVHETPVGFKWVADAMADHDALVGGEESGGFGVRGHLRNKDGVLVALLVAAAHAAEPLDERLDRIRAEHGDIVQDRVSVDCPDDRKAAVLEALDGDVPDRVAGSGVDSVVTADGFKLLLEDGSWLLVRPSGTEPKLRVYAEAGDESRVERLLAAGVDLVEPLI